MKSKLDTNPILRSKTVALHNFIDINGNFDLPKKDYILYFGRFSQERVLKHYLKPVPCCPM